VTEPVQTFPPPLQQRDEQRHHDEEIATPVDPAAPVIAIPSTPTDGVEVSSEIPTRLLPSAPRGPRPVEAPAGVEISYEQFGRHFIRRVLNLQRVLGTIDAMLGPSIELGPIGAGPGRAFASVSVVGRFSGTDGVEVPADLLTYAVNLPIDVTFTLDLPMDTLRFDAEVVVPLRIVVHTCAPTGIRMEIELPTESEFKLDIHPSTRRGAVFQKVTGLESELRRFLLKVVRTELNKPYIQRVLCLDMDTLIEDGWDHLSTYFLPQSAEDRK